MSDKSKINFEELVKTFQSESAITVSVEDKIKIHNDMLLSLIKQRYELDQCIDYIQVQLINLEQSQK